MSAVPNATAAIAAAVVSNNTSAAAPIGSAINPYTKEYLPQCKLAGDAKTPAGKDLYILECQYNSQCNKGATCIRSACNRAHWKAGNVCSYGPTCAATGDTYTSQGVPIPECKRFHILHKNISSVADPVEIKQAAVASPATAQPKTNHVKPAAVASPATAKPKVQRTPQASAPKILVSDSASMRRQAIKSLRYCPPIKSYIDDILGEGGSLVDLGESMCELALHMRSLASDLSLKHTAQRCAFMRLAVDLMAALTDASSETVVASSAIDAQSTVQQESDDRSKDDAEETRSESEFGESDSEPEEHELTGNVENSDEVVDDLADRVTTLDVSAGEPPIAETSDCDMDSDEDDSIDPSDMASRKGVQSKTKPRRGEKLSPRTNTDKFRNKFNSAARAPKNGGG
jgi:hypothetical protein